MAKDTSFDSDVNLKVRDLEERERLLRDRLNLLSMNFIEMKETLEKEVVSLKVDTEQMKSEIRKIKDIILRLSEELDNRAKKSELELVAKQLKIMKPLMI
jgi:methyl-accepting chemotaxis protein